MVCSYCDQVVDRVVCEEYFTTRAWVRELLGQVDIPAGTGLECLERMKGLFHPYDLTYMAASEVALTDCIRDSRLQEGLDIAHTMLDVCSRLARGSPAQVELVMRMMRLQAELGMSENMHKLVKKGLSDAYGDMKLCLQILQFERILKHTVLTKK